MNDKEIYIIGGDHYNTYGIVRSLGEKGVMPIVLLQGPFKHSFVLQSKYVKHGLACKTDNELLKELTAVSKVNKPVVICCSDQALSFVLSNYTSLSDKFILPICKDYKFTLSLIEKDYITAFAKTYGVNVPLSWTAKQRQLPEGLVYPVITKPLTSIGGHKSDLVVCNNEDELKRVFDSPNHCEDYQIQQYIDYEREVSILGCVLPDGEVVFSGCIDKLRTCMIGTSSFAVMVENGILGDEKKHLESMLKATGYTGLFSAEFLLKDGKYYFLEVNFRNDGNTYVATASGINLPYIWYQSCSGMNPKITEGHFPCYFMLDLEDFIARKRNKVSLRQWNIDRKKADCFLVFNKEDIKPFKKKVCIYYKDLFQAYYNGLKRRIEKYGKVIKRKNKGTRI